MIDIPVPKYKIGDIVWADMGYYGETNIVCPDCLGKKEWEVKTSLKATKVFELKGDLHSFARLLCASASTSNEFRSTAGADGKPSKLARWAELPRVVQGRASPQLGCFRFQLSGRRDTRNVAPDFP